MSGDTFSPVTTATLRRFDILLGSTVSWLSRWPRDREKWWA